MNAGHGYQHAAPLTTKFWSWEPWEELKSDAKRTNNMSSVNSRLRATADRNASTLGIVYE